MAVQGHKNATTSVFSHDKKPRAATSTTLRSAPDLCRLQQVAPVVLWFGQRKQLLLDLLCQLQVAPTCSLHKFSHQINEPPAPPWSESQGLWDVEARPQGVLQLEGATGISRLHVRCCDWRAAIAGYEDDYTQHQCGPCCGVWPDECCHLFCDGCGKQGSPPLSPSRHF